MNNKEQIEDKINMQNLYINQRIHVFTNEYDDLGLGTIVDFDVLEADSGEIITDKYATVELDNGIVLEQLNCIWYPIE